MRFEARGFSGGVWVLWDNEQVDVKLLTALRSFVHMEVLLEDGRSWLLTAVYVNSHPAIRNCLWE